MKMEFKSRPITFKSGLKRPLKAAGNEPLLSSLEKRKELRKFVRVEKSQWDKLGKINRNALKSELLV